MADCSYARCLQERRSIKRELQRWTKNMVYVVGLERVAEELMGRRKWKLYQDVLLARNLPLQQPDDSEQLSDSSPPEEDDHMIATTEAVQRHTPAVDLVTDQCQKLEQYKSSDNDIRVGSPIVLDEEEAKADAKEDESSPAPKDESQQPSSVGVQSVLKIKTIEQINTVGVDAGLNAKDGGGSEGSETILEGLIKRTSSGPPRRPLPADWTPQDKCYFCVDGELVRPGATNAPEPAPEQAASPVESESESSSSRSGTSPPRNQFLLNQQAQALAQLILQQQARLNPTMNQVQSMTASLAAIAALGGGANLPSALALCPPALLPHWYLNTRVNTPERGPVDSDKLAVTGSLSSPLTTEQPLDLSSKASAPNSSEDLKLSHGEGPSTTLESRLANLRVPPQLFKSKPRIVPPTGRRAYSEAELQAALRDIQSGKLGTRRAAVLYNIPRSTLRNKVYKLERERESRLPGSLPSSIDRDDSNDIGDELDDDKDSLMDEDKEEDREINRPVLSMEDILRFSQMDNTTENLQKLLQKGGQKFFDMESPKRDAIPDLWSCMDPNTMSPYIQSLFMASALGKHEENPLPMPEIARLLAEEQRNILKDHLLKQDHLNNGKPSEQSEDDNLNKRLFSRQSSSASSVITKNERTTPGRKTDSPEEPMEVVDQDGCGESRDSPSNVILKIPSFKPLATTPNSNKNGGDAFSGTATPPHPYFSHSPHADQASTPRASDHLSPPLVQIKGQSFSIKDVIAKSISQKFQQHVPPTNHNDLNQMSKLAAQNAEAMESLNVYKRGGLTPPMGSQNISVIKNLASHDLTRNFSNNSNQSQQNNATGGKGTRPKRGKYRNYDRDSLVEAVKAVQRGEMSVHRAGSYYGVPHSTLEYKVKERHLMRPRKREPKNPNPDDKLTNALSSKPSDIPGSGILRVDKPKPVQKPQSKPSFPTSSPNGLKMPTMFDPALTLGYNPGHFPFWPHAPAFSGLPVDFPPRNPGTSGSFPPESFFASQMMQRLQEESARHPVGSQKTPNSLLKSARDVAEFYEGAGGGANGSFLEGIIRTTLDQSNQRSRAGVGEDQDQGNRRLRPDDMMLAEEMREAVRKVRATRDPTPAATSSTPTPEAVGSPSPHPT